MNFILKDLNEQQCQAVLTVDGPVLIIAGAGSGKTKTLTHRVAYLLSKGVHSRNILAVTFTNKAANEMKERIMRLLDSPEMNQGHVEDVSRIPEFSSRMFRSGDLFIGTFHSLGARILRVEAGLRGILGFKSNFTIYDEEEQNGALKQIMKELNINTDQFNPQSIKYAISKAKNELVDAGEFANRAGGYFEEIASKVYIRYQEYLQNNNALDFDDLIFKVVLLFQKFPYILEKYQQRFQYIMVDEYQDTNHAQYVLVNLLAKKHRNIFAIGDDWQSIYLFRWADVQNILNFKKDYPEAKIIPLERNYRSSQQILDAAYSVIKKNILRTDKNLWTEKKDGHLITSFEAGSEKEESFFITDEIEKLKNVLGYGYKDFAVLYRTHAQSRALEEAFLHAGIPYKIMGGIKFYARAEVKDLLAFLKLMRNERDEVSFRRIIKLLGDGIGEKTLEKIIAYQRSNSLDFINVLQSDLEEIRLTPKAIQGTQRLQDIITTLVGYAIPDNKFGGATSERPTLSKLLELIIKKTDYLTYLETQDQSEARVENIKELFSVTQKYDQYELSEALRQFLEEVALVADNDNTEESNNVVSLMTLHSAKGLEFNVVFIPGLEEGILPHSRSIGNPTELEEERRLCYVGITRARDKVYLLFTRTRRIFGSVQANMKSRFLKDIPEELLERRENTDKRFDNFV